ncbi:MAG TPA: EpsI family protein, partial [Candidatus Hydrogenedentes bacterium]|nr:EpsI family protein [Candidatus Hydrogenedentota bacterium]
GLMFTARRLVLVKGNHREAVLYWFKTGDTLTGNYFLNAWYWVKDQASFGSSTSAMIKVATPVGPAGEEAAFELLEDFSMKFAPILLERVP